ncbi:sulfatase [Halobacteriaceae archaeon GCM10025711]
MATQSGRNVVFVVLDTVRKDHLSVYGYDRPTSPNLERFAEDAAVFDEAVAPAPWTLPVHASLFTGQYPSQHGASQENPYLKGSTTLAETLSEAGYATACYSANAWITPYTGLTRGFDEKDNFFKVMPGDLFSGPMASVWQLLNDTGPLRSVADWLVNVGNEIHERLSASGDGDTKTPAIIDRTIEFIDDADEPYFAFVNLLDAHLPYHPPAEQRDQFAPGVDSTAVCQNSKEYNSGARDIDDDEWDDIRDLYDAEIRHVDEQLGRLLDYLRETDDWDDTLVVVAADHGELHGENGLYGHEFAVYDPLVNVPLLVKHPELPADRYDSQVELIDLYHTVLDHARVDPTRSHDAVTLNTARSLLSQHYREFADGDLGAIGDGEYAFVEYFQPIVELNQLEHKAKAAGRTIDEDSRFYSRMRVARRPDAKYIQNERIPDEAYRLDEDPGEQENLANTGDPAFEELQVALDEFTERVTDGDRRMDATAPDAGGLDDMDTQAKDRLRELGYLD